MVARCSVDDVRFLDMCPRAVPKSCGKKRDSLFRRVDELCGCRPALACFTSRSDEI